MSKDQTGPTLGHGPREAARGVVQVVECHSSNIHQKDGMHLTIQQVHAVPKLV